MAALQLTGCVNRVGSSHQPQPPCPRRCRALTQRTVCVPERICALVLDRPRHEKIIASIRAAGASIQLITDGDVAGVIATTEPETTGIDIYIGQGGAPEGVLAAAALRCVGGQMQTRLVFRNDEERFRAERLGIRDFKR